jgi:hypothetical protein
VRRRRTEILLCCSCTIPYTYTIIIFCIFTPRHPQSHHIRPNSLGSLSVPERRRYYNHDQAFFFPPKRQRPWQSPPLWAQLPTQPPDLFPLHHLTTIARPACRRLPPWTRQNRASLCRPFPVSSVWLMLARPPLTHPHLGTLHHGLDDHHSQWLGPKHLNTVQYLSGPVCHQLHLSVVNATAITQARLQRI